MIVAAGPVVNATGNARQPLRRTPNLGLVRRWHYNAAALCDPAMNAIDVVDAVVLIDQKGEYRWQLAARSK
jgi:hypothetical protein